MGFFHPSSRHPCLDRTQNNRDREIEWRLQKYIKIFGSTLLRRPWHGHAVKINIPGAEHAITSDQALVVDSLPAKQPVVIVGGGYIGVEFACIFKGLGADVHLICRQKYPLGVFDGKKAGFLVFILFFKLLVWLYCS